MAKNFQNPYKRYFSLISIFFILILILPSCNIHKNNDEPEIANSIKTKIGNNPPKFDFINKVVMAENNSDMIQKAKKDYLQALNLLKRVGNDKKLLYLTDQNKNLELVAQKMKDAAEENDNWIETWEYAKEVLVDGYYVLPFSLSDNDLPSLYGEALDIYKTLTYEVEKLSQKTLEYENNNKINFESWLNLSYVENTIEDVRTNLFKQVEQLLSEYVKLSRESGTDEKTQVQRARALGSTLSVLQMAKNQIECSQIIIDTIKIGQHSEEDKREILDLYRERAGKVVEAISAKIKSKSWGEELYKYSVGNYNTAKKLEKNNFYSLALIKYQLAYIFATLSKNWMEYPDIIHYGDLKANDVSVENIIRSWNDSVKEFEEIDKKLDQYEKEGKVFLNIRLVTNIFYKSWFNVGDGFLRRFIETQSNWKEVGNIAYMNIGPVPFALKIIEEDLENLSKVFD
ncbi:hypothetical protein VTU32_03660 [Thermoanaerobacter sp. CM-CNRG TB177]|uniref:hypothetical protein n=1 Tax=unclassified Thermoanaerobacter TaxID=2636821 RepID=UPI0000E1E290|nr:MULTISPECIES: hypothetical protein [unclassified Thermoanaerobacter]ABY93632.1 hypothetical protein Teth514_2372 [Thermoanaerobacter sp. X514]MBT1279361.1 hypothetical protein [Thermoanaerobacter sp. CM-CNRG TB177]